VQPYTFLAALPALLGLAGFVLYQALGANKSGDEISRRIIEKLRSGQAGELPLDKRLTPKQIADFLEHSQRLRKLIDDQDFRLLQQALKQQFIITIFVYVLTLAFCSWSVYLFAHSSPGAFTAGHTQQSQSSTGKNSPNIISSGSGPVTVSIKDQTKTTLDPAKADKK
jgi:hypothetical protein